MERLSGSFDCFDEQQDGRVAKTLVHEFHDIRFGCAVIRKRCEFRVVQGGCGARPLQGPDCGGINLDTL